MKLRIALALSFAVVMLTSTGGALMSRTNSLAASPVAATFIGTWRTTWKNVDGHTGSAPVTVKADSTNANALDGFVETEGPNGVMYGMLSADRKTWSGDWWNSKGEKGTFTFTLTGNRSFDGSYTIEGTAGSFSWSGTR
ncbi:MAG TPA: hypothetical protein VK619_05555 [Pyrinomonadaceae bacterium]|nr:hypothetical protein [Pyrinomonadaceae bacterium]